MAGGSNGGLLMGAVLTQRPELFRAVVVQVPLLDMLRYHRFLIARLWIPEYGSPDDPEAVRLASGVLPVPPRAARARPIRPCSSPPPRATRGSTRCTRARWRPGSRPPPPPPGRCCLRLEARAGHGAGKPLSKVLDELTDTWTFVFSEVGVEV